MPFKSLVSVFIFASLGTALAETVQRNRIAFLNPNYQFEQVDEKLATLVLERSQETLAFTAIDNPVMEDLPGTLTTKDEPEKVIYITTTVTKVIFVTSSSGEFASTTELAEEISSLPFNTTTVPFSSNVSESSDVTSNQSLIITTTEEKNENKNSGHLMIGYVPKTTQNPTLSHSRRESAIPPFKNVHASKSFSENDRGSHNTIHEYNDSRHLFPFRRFSSSGSVLSPTYRLAQNGMAILALILLIFLV